MKIYNASDSLEDKASKFLQKLLSSGYDCTASLNKLITDAALDNYQTLTVRVGLKKETINSFELQAISENYLTKQVLEANNPLPENKELLDNIALLHLHNINQGFVVSHNLPLDSGAIYQSSTSALALMSLKMDADICRLYPPDKAGEVTTLSRELDTYWGKHIVQQLRHKSDALVDENKIQQFISEVDLRELLIDWAYTISNGQDSGLMISRLTTIFNSMQCTHATEKTAKQVSSILGNSPDDEIREVGNEIVSVVLSKKAMDKLQNQSETERSLSDEWAKKINSSTLDL